MFLRIRQFFIFVFDFISDKGLAAGNFRVGSTGNATRMTFTINNAEAEIPGWSDRIERVTRKSYLEGYPVEGVRYSFITKRYIKSKRDKYFVARVEFGK